MDILSQAIRSIQHNLSILATYLVITVTSSAVALLGNVLMGDPGPDTSWTAGMIIYEILIDAFLVVMYAGAQAIVFSRLAKVLDRPLWKCADDREALRRYFTLWAILNAAAIVLQRLTGLLPALLDDERAAFLPFWLFVLAMVLYIPFGAAIMFSGRFEWENLGELLAPYQRQLPKLLIIAGFSGLLLFFFLSVLTQTESQSWVKPIIDVISGYFDCVIFAAAWHTLILDRQTPRENDFEF